ncbi:DUF72 domain-containing protein [Trinickia diaoshuihuensis]|uniref:DUF72 domain-containing protein n=1 Tax=Trinickia diaoshuihuensis TaxID=2292265 RepID=UPI000E259FCF|nr:DUF72 domain-containing protein [Trinickia diaoshuihuensis]
MTILIGISGWRYAGWRGVFYPKGLSQARELAYASRAVDTIEINGSHYSLQTIGSYRSWYEATPEHFVFSVKGPRYLTHMLRFRDESARPAIANFFASGVLALEEKLGPFLWQFPPNFHFDATRLERFLALLPKTIEEAIALAREHDTRVKTPWFETERRGKLRHAVEVRHPSFCVAEFPEILRRHDASLVVSDSVAGWPYFEDITAQFVYMRLHGTETLYSGAYADPALDRWAERIRAWAAGGEPGDAKHVASKPARRAARDVFCYFDNDQKVEAPFDAARLKERLSGDPAPVRLPATKARRGMSRGAAAAPKTS